MKGTGLAQLITSNKQRIIVGVGATGRSVAHYFADRGERFLVVDSQSAPPGLDAFHETFPDIPVETGELQTNTLLAASEIIISPGVPLSEPALVAAKQAGIPVIGDIELFAREAKAPIVAITGSNGKSTVTTLVGNMCIRAGKKTGVGGNLGTPALELLNPQAETYVLELSSFQLEAVERLNAEVAVVLNLSPDHMDRYASLIDYHSAKHRIFKGVHQVVVNRDDPLSQPLVSADIAQRSFGLQRPDINDFGLLAVDGENWLAKGSTPLMPVRQLGIKGSHNTSNALAALALGEAVGLPVQVMLQELREFTGLAHRCQTVATVNGVTFVNDSKATNVGATIAAIEGMQGQAKLVLIAGGQGKGQNFSDLGDAIAKHHVNVVLIGEDADQVASSIDGAHRSASLEEAVELAARLAAPDGLVLLSPACASFDMFSGFEERGSRFAEIVEGMR